jgi:hypothetical protein
MAANHLVGLLGQVQRVAESVGLPLEAFLPLARGALDDVGLLGPAAALTGPVARGDLSTIERHRRALDPSELDGYDAGIALVRRLAASAPPRPLSGVLARSPAAAGGERDAGTARDAGRKHDENRETVGIAGNGSWS